MVCFADSFLTKKIFFDDMNVSISKDFAKMKWRNYNNSICKNEKSRVGTCYSK